MADDLEELRARVAAARERLASDVDFAQKVELRLNDLARIVDGSLARQSAELETAQQRIAELDADLGRALARAEQAAGDAARSDRLAKENSDLKSMVMTLLEVIEGRQKSSLASVMQKLEENVSALVTAPATAPQPGTVEAAEPEPELEPGPEPEQEPAPEEHDLGPESAGDVELEAEPQLEPEDLAIDAALDETARIATAPIEESIEDLSEIALYDASEEVVEPDKD
jgi:hypothetical protein